MAPDTSSIFVSTGSVPKAGPYSAQHEEFNRHIGHMLAGLEGLELILGGNGGLMGEVSKGFLAREPLTPRYLTTVVAADSPKDGGIAHPSERRLPVVNKYARMEVVRQQSKLMLVLYGAEGTKEQLLNYLEFAHKHVIHITNLGKPTPGLDSQLSELLSGAPHLSDFYHTIPHDSQAKDQVTAVARTMAAAEGMIRQYLAEVHAAEAKNRAA